MNLTSEAAFFEGSLTEDGYNFTAATLILFDTLFSHSKYERNNKRVRRIVNRTIKKRVRVCNVFTFRSAYLCFRRFVLLIRLFDAHRAEFQ